MAVVSGVVNYRCRDSAGRFYYLHLPREAQVEETATEDEQTEALFAVAAEEAPGDCVDMSITGMTFTPGSGLPPGPETTVDVYYYVWCIGKDGSKIGPYTQYVTVPTTIEIGVLTDIIDAAANEFCGNRFGLAPLPEYGSYEWEIISPLMFAYARGAG